MSNKKVKLNTALAVTDHQQAVYKNGLADYSKFFSQSQGAFKGEKKTYTPREGTVDYPNERASRKVVTTVREKLEYFENNVSEYINTLFAVESTNASGTVVTDLIVEGKNLGRYSSLELLRLKSLLESQALKDMYEKLPVRDEKENWEPTKDTEYDGRDIFETPVRKGVNKTTTKESYILSDPNIGKIKDTTQYTPQIATRDTVVELGDYEHRTFSGETSHAYRAGILKRRSILLGAVIEALKVANEAELLESQMTGKKLFDYLHRGGL